MYEFSAYSASLGVGGETPVRLMFDVWAGGTLNAGNSGTLVPDAQTQLAIDNVAAAGNQPEWKRTSVTFSTAGFPPGTVFYVQIRNSQPGGGGNDFMVDDIAVTKCLPNVYIESGGEKESLTTCATTGIDLAMLAVQNVLDVIAGGSDNGNTVYYQWRQSNSPTGPWTPITGIPTQQLQPNQVATIHTPNAATGTITYYQAKIASTQARAEDWNLDLNLGCGNDAMSNVFKVEIQAGASITDTTPGSNCGTGTVNLTAVTSNAGGIVDWYDAATGGTLVGSSNSGAAWTTPSISTNTTYYAEVQGSPCEGSRVAVTATIHPQPEITITEPSTTVLTCTTPSITLNTTSTNAATYSWSPGGATTSSINVTAAGTYTVTATSATGNCIATDDIKIDLNKTAPTVAITNPATRELTCTTTSISLAATGADSYVWTRGGTNVGNTATINATEPGIYTVTGTSTANGCTNTAQIEITENTTLPTVGIDEPATRILTCSVKSINLTATGAVSYSWSDGTNVVGTAATLSVGTAGTYTVTGTAANGCTNTASISITSDGGVPTVAITEPSTRTLTCTTTSIALTATGAVSYVWSNSATTAGITVNTPNTYSVTGTAANGCTATASISIGEDIDKPTLAITEPATRELTCDVTSITLATTGTATSYAWTPGNATTASINVTEPATYTVTGTGANGCTQTASIDISQDIVKPTVAITDPATEVLTCTTTNIDLTATGAVSYEWSTNETTATISVDELGTYVVEGTGANGCSNTANIFIDQDITAPTLTISPSAPELTCDVKSITLTASASGAGTTYEWGDGSTNATLTITSAGTYEVTATAANGCETTESIKINGDTTVPTVEIAEPTTKELTCTTTSITLTATSNVGNYTWSNGATTATISVTEPGTYSVTSKAVNGCDASAQIVISEDTLLPTVAITPPATTELTCDVTSIVLNATGNADSYAWSGSATGTGTSLTVTEPGNYIVTGTGANGCTNSDNIDISENITAPTLTIAASAPELTCDVTSITLTASASGTGTTYLWENGTTGATLTVTAAGTYEVTATSANGCETTEDIEIKGDTTVPTVSIEEPTTKELTCTTTSITLTATSNVGNYTWSNGATTASIIVTEPGTYSVTSKAVNGCDASAQIVISENVTLPTVAITTPATTELTCDVTSITLNATGNADSYAWSGSATGSGASLTVTEPGNYIVTGTGANGCTNTANIDITENITPPTVSIAAPVTELTCAVNSVTLTASASGTGTAYSWSNGETTAAINVTTTGTYTVIATATNGCTAQESVTVTESIDAPAVSIASDETELTCDVTTIELTASGDAATYKWSTGATTASIDVTALGTYTVTATSANGCTAQESITITQDITQPAVSIASDETELTCSVTDIDLTASGTAVSYEWEDGSTNAVLNVTAAGTYTVIATGANGCTAQESITITRSADMPVVEITDPTTAELTCSVTSITLEVTGDAVSYSWSTGDNGTTTAVTAPGTYTVTGIDADGCTSTDQIIITQDITPPTVSISAPVTVLTCDVTSVVLTATGDAVSYVWGDGTTGASFTAAAAGTYTVTATGANGCTNTASITVTENIAKPTVSISSDETVLTCTDQSIELTASGSGVSYLWDNGATTASITVSTAGTYTVTATGANGCKETTSISITKDDSMPTVSIAAPVMVLTCAAPSATLTASGNGVSYLWDNGATTAAITVTEQGTYGVTTTGANGCTASTSVTITEDVTLPTVAITEPVTTELTCDVTSIELTATGTGVSYAWTGTATGTGASLSVTAPGTYTVTATGANGCTETASIVITQDITVPTVSIAAPVIELTCTVTSATLTASGDAVSYEWSTGETTASIEVTAVGTYTVTATGENGCISTESVTISENIDKPVISVTNPVQCVTPGVMTEWETLVASDGKVRWYETVDAPMPMLEEPYGIDLSFAGTYTYYADAISNNGCVSDERVEVTITVNESPRLEKVNDAILNNVRAFVVGGQSPYEYHFEGVSGITDREIELGLLSIGKHNLLVIDANGCQLNTDIPMLKLQLIPDEYFSPNGDAQHPTWTIKNLEHYLDTNILIAIYDRNGKELLNETAPEFLARPNNGWDGTFNGEDMPSTDYWYIITIDKLGENIKGHFSLKR
jgi:gliding motility-associated-like protein